ncbi:hypothetical protein K9M48_02120 [Candidatus Gracilibacteria bacterium]|nr:hypothetical protein [Candidatus Gracilibacteria bacterium]
MKLIKNEIRKRMANRHLGRNMIGSVAVNVMKRFLKDNLDIKNIDDIISGYVRFNKLFVKTSDQKIKIFLYKKKQELLEKINESLANLGYKTRLSEIFFK